MKKRRWPNRCLTAYEASRSWTRDGRYSWPVDLFYEPMSESWSEGFEQSYNGYTDTYTADSWSEERGTSIWLEEMDLEEVEDMDFEEEE